MNTMLLAFIGGLCLATAAMAEPAPETIMTPPTFLNSRAVGGEFDELETIANYERTSHMRFVGGGSPILQFYEVLARFNHPDGSCPLESYYTFDAKREALERWLAAKPESPTPKIALARFWLEYAWAGRGCDWSTETTDAQFQAFHSRLHRVVDVLRDVDPDVDPEVYLIEMRAVAIDEHPRERLNFLYEKATLAFPDEREYAKERYFFLQPRWYGRPGEAAAFAKSLLTTPGGDAGLNAYFSIAQGILSFERRYDVLLTDTGLDYSTLSKAFVRRVDQFGGWTGDMNVLMYYGVAANDRATVNLLAQKIGDAWDYSLWKDKSYVDSIVAWARR